MIDWEWLKSINAFQGCVGQFMGFIGMIVGVAGTYIVTTLNYTRQNKKEQIDKEEKRRVGLKLILNEIKVNNSMLKSDNINTETLMNSDWSTYKNYILFKGDNLSLDILSYYMWIDFLCNMNSKPNTNTIIANKNSKKIPSVIEDGYRIMKNIKIELNIN